MHPIVRHRRRAMRAPRLGNLILMMRENEIQAAAVNIEDVAKISGAHRRALDVPARASPAPWAFPSRLIARRLLPQYEIERALLMCIDGNPRARPLLVELTA